VRDRVFEAVQFAAINRVQADGLQNMRDLDTLRGFIAGNGLTAACDLPWTPFYILVCTLFHPLMGAMVAAGALALCGLTYAAELMSRRPTLALVGLASERRVSAETSFHHAEVVKALGMTGTIGALWSQRTTAFLDAQSRSADLTGAFGSASRFLRMILQSGVLAMGAYLVVNQQATAGVMLAATVLSIRALAPIELAIANWRNFISARDSFHRLSETFTELPEPSSPTPLPAPCRELRATALSLTAPGTEKVLLHEVNFALRAGSAVAVIGPSGSGKSSLARALVGIWPAARGVIRIDGAALALWPADALGRHVGFLPQDVALFRGTIAQNIARFEPKADPAEILAAANEAGVHELILRLPAGYETEVGEGGLMLSGGQRQRVALARALYRRPFLVVLDEPNSNLDAEGERALALAIRGIRARGGIVVVIAHRPSVLGSVDHLLVLNEGRMQAFGTTEAVLPLVAGKPKAASPATAPQPASAARPAPAATSPRRAVSRNGKSRQAMPRDDHEAAVAHE
jgi:PrtD family type I secretion system ABC transporter